MDRIIFLLFTSNKKNAVDFFAVLPYMEKSLHLLQKFVLGFKVMD